MSTPLRTLVHELLYDASSRAAFSADPAEYLGAHGWDDLDGRDVGTALGALVDELPIDDAVRLSPIAHGADAYDADGGGAVAGLRAAAAAFDDVETVEPWLDPATTLDDSAAADGAGDNDAAMGDDPSAGIDDEGDGRWSQSDTGDDFRGDEPREDDDVGTLDDATAPGSPLAFEEDGAGAHVDVWFDDAVASLLDPLAVDGYHAPESFSARRLDDGDELTQDDPDDG